MSQHLTSLAVANSVYLTGYRAEIVGVSFGDVDPLSIKTVTHYEKALEEAEKQGIQIRVFLLCNPHNPLGEYVLILVVISSNRVPGRCYTPGVLKAYMQFCQKHNLHLISDEVYALSVWKNPEAPDAPEFTSALAINPDGLIDRGLLHILWGMGKVWHCIAKEPRN